MGVCFSGVVNRSFTGGCLAGSVGGGGVGRTCVFRKVSNVNGGGLDRRLSGVLLSARGMRGDPSCVGVCPSKGDVGVTRVEELRASVVMGPRGRCGVCVVGRTRDVAVRTRGTLLGALRRPPRCTVVVLVADGGRTLLSAVGSEYRVVGFLPVSLMSLGGCLVDRKVSRGETRLLSAFTEKDVRGTVRLSRSTRFTVVESRVRACVRVVLSGSVVSVLRVPTDVRGCGGSTVDVLSVLVGCFESVVLLGRGMSGDVVVGVSGVAFLRGVDGGVACSRMSGVVSVVRSVGGGVEDGYGFGVDVRIVTLGVCRIVG